MRVCKPNEIAAIFGMGGPSFGSYGVSSFVPPAPAPAPNPAPVAQDSSAHEDLSFSSTDGGDGNTGSHVVAQASPPTFTSSMPSTTNPTVSVTADNSGSWISTTVTMPSSTTTATNSAAVSSMPSTINPTSNAQPSTIDVANLATLGDTAVALNGLSAGLSTFGGPAGKAAGGALGVAIDGLGLDVKDLSLQDFMSPQTPVSLGPFGYPGYNQIGELGFTAPSPLGPDPAGICGPNYGLENNIGPSSMSPSETSPSTAETSHSEASTASTSTSESSTSDASSSASSSSDSAGADSAGNDS